MDIMMISRVAVSTHAVSPLFGAGICTVVATMAELALADATVVAAAVTAGLTMFCANTVVGSKMYRMPNKTKAVMALTTCCRAFSVKSFFMSLSL